MGCGKSTLDAGPVADADQQQTSPVGQQQQQSRQPPAASTSKASDKNAPPLVSEQLSLDPSKPATKRITKETERILKNPIAGIAAVPDELNPRHFHLTIDGPEGCPFEGGIFKVFHNQFFRCVCKVCETLWNSRSPALPHSWSSSCPWTTR